MHYLISPSYFVHREASSGVAKTAGNQAFNLHEDVYYMTLA